MKFGESGHANGRKKTKETHTKEERPCAYKTRPTASNALIRTPIFSH